MPTSIVESSGYRYIDKGSSNSHTPIVLLHGMLGDLNNWRECVDTLAEEGFRVIVPVLPVYDMPLSDTSISGLVAYVRGFIETLGLDATILVGNSLGGHVAVSYVLQYPDDVQALVLSGASGIYEVNAGTSVPRRHDREFIRERAEVTFYDPVHVTDDLIDDMYSVVSDRARVVRLIKMARSAKEEIVTDLLSTIETPTLLVWGRDDQITPPAVAYEFLERLPNATLHFIERCGHAPMIEHPEEFNRLMLAFLKEVVDAPDAKLNL
jgi:2-hydroxy-6-oxonona-2,4-dienedioate hydrolase